MLALTPSDAEQSELPPVPFFLRTTAVIAVFPQRSLELPTTFRTWTPSPRHLALIVALPSSRPPPPKMVSSLWDILSPGQSTVLGKSIDRDN